MHVLNVVSPYGATSKASSVIRKCELWIHARCCQVSQEEYRKLRDEGENSQWLCPRWLLAELPFVDLDMSNDHCSLIDNSLLSPEGEDSGLPPDGMLEADPPSLSDVLKRSKDGQHFCHLNARVLLRCIDEIRDFCYPKSCSRMFLSFSETWLNSDTPDGMISIPGYSVYRKDRCGHGGGVAIYCPNGSKCKRREDLERTNLEAI